CRIPPISAGTREGYSAASVKSLLCQTTSPVSFFSASTAPLEPPGVHTTLSPSRSGDSEYFQPPTLPPKSLSRFLRHFSLPLAASTQANSPKGASERINFPSVDGLQRGLPQSAFRFT